jgi:hypothetical protein
VSSAHSARHSRPLRACEREPRSGLTGARSDRQFPAGSGAGHLAWAVRYGTAAEDRAMRGPYGIVGLVVTIVVIYLVLHFLGVI